MLSMKLESFDQIKQNIIDNYVYYDIDLMSRSGKTFYHNETGIAHIRFVDTKFGVRNKLIKFSTLDSTQLNEYIPVINELAIAEYKEFLTQYEEYITEHLKNENMFIRFLDSYKHIITKYNYQTEDNDDITIYLNDGHKHGWNLIDCYNQNIIIYHIKKLLESNPNNFKLDVSKEIYLIDTHTIDFDFIQDALEDYIKKYLTEFEKQM